MALTILACCKQAGGVALTVSETVRKVATAICEAEGENPQAAQPNARDIRHPAKRWEAKVAQAKAALGALREPTPAMKQAGRDAVPVAMSDRAAKDCFHAMIEQAKRG